MSERIAVHIAICVSAILGWNLSRAVAVGVSDGFEDGNWTANPAWVDTNPGYGVDGGVVADPVRPSNLVWKATGTGGAPRNMATSEFTPMPWAGFHSSVEIFRSGPGTGTIYNANLWVFDNMQARNQGKAQGFQLWFDEGRSTPGMARLQLYELNPTGSVPRSKNWSPAEVGTNEWLQVNLWGDPASGLVKADVRRLSDGYVYVEDSIVPMSFGESPLSYLEIGAGSPVWNYLDNATLTPEPGTLALLILGGLGAMRRRR